MLCTECSFVQTKNIISVTADTITTGINEPEPCPNGCGQLQPVTWKALAIQLMFTTKQGVSDLLESKKRIAELDAELEREREQTRRVMSRIAEVESRTVTVKLPQAVSAGGQGYQEQVERMLTAAGVKVEAKC